MKRLSASTAPRCTGGYVLGLTVHLCLVLLVLGMVVFLASRYRVRVDLTADRLFTLTDSTRKVLDRVEQRLRIEAYFSPDETLATVNREGRRTLRAVLDEYVQQGRGRVVVQYLDPQSDSDLRKQAERLGIKPQQVQDMEGSTLSNRQLYQGLRFLYGGDRQKVVPIVGFTEQPWLYEAALTPIVKALTVAEKPRIGVMQWGTAPLPESQFARQEPPRGYDRILGIPEITDRYEFVPVDMSRGQLVPDDLDTLVLLRPKELGERQKYAFDQFLMRGGHLVVFADSDEVSLGQARSMRTSRVNWDGKNPSFRFLEQLASYGAVVQDRYLLDLVSPPVAFGYLAATPAGGGAVMQALQMYPYWYQPAAIDWADRAEMFAQRPDGGVDDALVTAYRKQFLPGVDPELAKGLTAPAFFWPCAVDLAETLPEGVTGQVLMRSSPRSMLQTPPQSVHPLGLDRSGWQEVYNRFIGELGRLAQSEQPQQHGLMVSLSGSFKSWFAGRSIPPRPGQATAAESADPLESPIGSDPTQPTPEGPDRPDPNAAGSSPDKDADPAPRTVAAPGAQLVVIGDATFLRDDLVGGEYQQAGGPVSNLGPMFFANLLDWLAQDRDLFDLRAKGAGVDRRLRLVADTEFEKIPAERMQQEIDGRAKWLRLRIVAIPPALLILGGFVVLALRRASKRNFLARTAS